MVTQESYQDLREENPNPNTQDLDDAEEALSLCDLPIYSAAAAAAWEDFWREDHRSSASSSDQDYFEFFSEQWSASSYPPDNIVFCGKLIPFKKTHSDDTIKLEGNKQRKTSKERILLWSFKSFNRSRILASPAKSRWHLFGLYRFPTEMEMRDTRKRQNRQDRSTSTWWNGEKSGRSRRKGGMWGLIRALTCGGHHHTNAVVKASFGCDPVVLRE